jgi:hypothetical protein
MITPESYMLELNWNWDDMVKAKNMLIEWDHRDNSFYKNVSPFTKKVDLAEREHLRNTIKFWEEKLANETE